MCTKYLLIILSAVLLLQSNAIPVAEETATNMHKPLTPLFIFTLKKFIELIDVSLIDGKQLLQHVVDEFSTLEHNNEEVKKKLEKCQKLLADIKALDTRDDSDKIMDKFDFMYTLEMLMGKEDVTESEEAYTKEPSDVDKQFHESFKRHGRSEFKKKFNDRFEALAKEFIAEFEKIIDTATAENWPRKNKDIDWLNDFKAEKNVEKRRLLLDSFLQYFFRQMDVIKINFMFE